MVSGKNSSANVRKCLTMTCLALIITETILLPVSSSPTGSRVSSEVLDEFLLKTPNINFADAPSPSGCGFVFQNAEDLSRAIAAHRIGRDHKIIKYIENCYKTADGWRFKKSAFPSNFWLDKNGSSEMLNEIQQQQQQQPHYHHHHQSYQQQHNSKQEMEFENAIIKKFLETIGSDAALVNELSKNNSDK